MDVRIARMSVTDYMSIIIMNQQFYSEKLKLDLLLASGSSKKEHAESTYVITHTALVSDTQFY